MLGAGLKYGNIQNKVYLFFVCIGKLIIIPLVFVLIGYWLGFRESELATIFALSSVPTAVNTYVMAKELGADGDLAEKLSLSHPLFDYHHILMVLLLTGIGWI